MHRNVHFEAYVQHGTFTPLAMHSNWSSLNFTSLYLEVIYSLLH